MEPVQYDHTMSAAMSPFEVDVASTGNPGGRNDSDILAVTIEVHNPALFACVARSPIA